jgi:hypothetical protein
LERTARLDLGLDLSLSVFFIGPLLELRALLTERGAVSLPSPRFSGFRRGLLVFLSAPVFLNLPGLSDRVRVDREDRPLCLPGLSDRFLYLPGLWDLFVDLLVLCVCSDPSLIESLFDFIRPGLFERPFFFEGVGGLAVSCSVLSLLLLVVGLPERHSSTLSLIFCGPGLLSFRSLPGLAARAALSNNFLALLIKPFADSSDLASFKPPS